jgi:hypothetical protein
MRTQLLLKPVLILFLVLTLAGCSPQEKKASPTPPISGKITSFAEVVAFTPVPVQGYGIVAGLAGTGSGQCPPQIRSQLKQYILAQLPKNSPMTADKLLDSHDTAVVKIIGAVPPAADKGELFDLQITPFPGTQTTSFAGGRLYTANLTFVQGTKKIASAYGPIFLDMLGNYQPTVGYILGGGSTFETYNLMLALYNANYRNANVIRNRITERFGDSTVMSSSAGVIQIKIPQKYILQKSRFITLLKELYINETPQQETTRTQQLIEDLSNSEKSESAEIALEAIGKTQEAKVAAILTSTNFQARFRAARCLLYFGNDQGLGILRQAAIDPTSPYRLEAIEAIAIGAKRNDAITILKPLLADSDLKVRLAAYEQLRRLNDPAISTMQVADDFEVDQVFAQGTKVIYVYRSNKPRIVIFGAPLIANPNIFIESADGTVIVNSPGKNTYVSCVRRYPQRNITLGPIKSSFAVHDIIRTLSDPPTNENKKRAHLGLGLPYADTIAILNTMCIKGAVDAEFVAGPLPKFKTESPPAPPQNTPTNVMESPLKGR